MYAAIDVGGTKTLVACLEDNGVILEQIRIPTPKSYSQFIKKLTESVDNLTTKEFIAAGVGIPGKVDRTKGVGIAFGNLPWRNVPIQNDIKNIFHCPVILENDANLAGLSEAMLLPEHQKVLYVTVSTGIGTGFIVDRTIEPSMADTEGGHILLEHQGKIMAWEDFASGRAIVEQFGKKASEITDSHTWNIIAHNLSIGLIDLIAVMQPDVIVLGGGVGTHYHKFESLLLEDLKRYENPLFSLPIIRQAARPEEAVIYGCYDLAREVYGQSS